MANATGPWKDEIDSILMQHIQSMGKVFDDLKEVAASTAMVSADLSLMCERIDSAQQRTKETCFAFILTIMKWIRKEYNITNATAAKTEKSEPKQIDRP